MATRPAQSLYRLPATTDVENPQLYSAGGLHPVHIGDYLKDKRYRIVHKLGFGSFSTVWLARDVEQDRYVSLKIGRADFSPDSNEVKILRYLGQGDAGHEGRHFVARLSDDFVISGPNGQHKCIVTQVAGNRLCRPQGVNYSCLGPSRLLMSQLFLALDYLNSCNIGHGDMYTGNILFQLDNFDSWSDEQLYECMGWPVKEDVIRIDGEPLESCVPAYVVHSGDLHRLEEQMMLFKLLIVDFGGAYFLDNPPLKTTTPSQYSAPEVLRSLGVSPASDLWALGCATFEICAGYTLFKALFLPRQDVMKDMVSMLGKPPEGIWKAWEQRLDYFEEDGTPAKRSDESIIVKSYPLYDRVRDMAWLYPRDGRQLHTSQRDQGALESIELQQMYDFLKGIFVFEPSSRISVKDALAHPFLALTNFHSLE